MSAPEPAAAARPLVAGLTRDELGAILAGLGEPAYRAGQIWSWLHIKHAAGWSQMTNLPAALRGRLDEHLDLQAAEALETSGDPGDTRKILVGLRDGERVEAVLIPAPDRRTVCVSSQVGCRWRCAFCASGQSGFRRDLEAGEMVAQVLLAARVCGARPTHAVFMGIGEPFDNYDAVLKAVRILNDKDGLAIGARRITISTSGVIPGIERLAGEGLQVELSVSLHAPDDALRSRLMPVNRRYPLASLLETCRDYTAKTGRIITFEYTLIRGVNDTRRHAEALGALLAGRQARVNLIPLSPVEEFDGQPPLPDAANLFIGVLRAARVNASLRQSRGGPLRAACGQLRHTREKERAAPPPDARPAP